MAARVFHVTLTKEFDCTILAESEEDLEEALKAEESNIDRDWNPPEWDFSIHDPLKGVKNPDKIPRELSKFDMVVLGDVDDLSVYSADEGGNLKLQIEAVKERAEAELRELRLKLGLAEVNAKLPFETSKP